MDAPQRGALMLVRFVAAALIGWTIVELALYLAISRHNQTEIKIFPCVVKSLSALVGLVMLVKSKSFAEWISNILDD
jgi:hypothetical protein